MTNFAKLPLRFPKIPTYKIWVIIFRKYLNDTYFSLEFEKLNVFYIFFLITYDNFDFFLHIFSSLDLL